MVMEAIPSLCASGTVGVAAAGFAFGRPQHSVAARPTSNKRRATPQNTALHNSDFGSSLPTTPAPAASATTASTSKLRKRQSGAPSLTAPETLKRGARPSSTILSGEEDYEAADVGTGLRPLQGKQSRQSMGGRSSILEAAGSETGTPSWLHRKSTLSSLKGSSPATTDGPGSASITTSIGSAAPILPRDWSPSTPSRNKLVKRSSSQRALQGSIGMHSSLRRPATSHQRSATLLQHHFMHDEDLVQKPVIDPPVLDHESELHEFNGGSSQPWQPFFRPSVSGPGKDRSSRKRNAHGGLNKEDSFKCIVPDITELPTLMMATSINSGPSDDANRRQSTTSALSRPFTPVGFATYYTSSFRDTDAAVASNSESRPRNSLSLSDMFPSPSPTTWRMPRMETLRNKRSFARGGKRISSAPQVRNRGFTISTLDAFGPSGPRTDKALPKTPTSPLDDRSTAINPYPQSPGSPLPPLKHLSAFEVNLPESVPSYPTSPQVSEVRPPSRPFSSPISPSPSTQMLQSINRDQSHRPSGAPSDYNSTLLGSDNSRLMFADDEDIDGRSETVYDSTRSAATGNGTTNFKRPAIDTIFDESPPRETASKETTGSDSIDELEDWNRDIVTLQPRIDRPVLVEISNKSSGAVGNPIDIFGGASTTHPVGLDGNPNVAVPSVENDHENMRAPPTNEEVWGLDDPSGDMHRGRKLSGHEFASTENGLSEFLEGTESTPRRHASPPTDADHSSKANIFEWSEHLEPETSPGGSSRPKTVHGRHGQDPRGSRLSGRHGVNAIHLRSQSVPVPDDHRNHAHASKLDSWVLGNKGPSEDWDEDFDFEEASPTVREPSFTGGPIRTSMSSSGMAIPRTILERQATVHVQFGQVKELTLLVEELKRLQQQASALDIMQGQASELWKEAEGIINLATVDEDEHNTFPPPLSPLSPGSVDFDAFEDDSPSGRRRRSEFSSTKDDHLGASDETSTVPSSRPSQDLSSRLETPPPMSRPRKESSAKAKSVLETIHSQRSPFDRNLLDGGMTQKKLPFDTTSLKDLVTRAGAVTRALKEIVRRAEGGSPTPQPQLPLSPLDPPFSQIFNNVPAQEPPVSSSTGKISRVTRSPRSGSSSKGTTTPKSPKSPKNTTSFRGGAIANNDNEINGHMKMMTVV